ncbi:MAG: carbohydrate ABC transporter permease [Spirochaetota bacterium]
MKHKIKKRLENSLLWFYTAVISFIILLPLYWIFLSSVTPLNKLFTSPIHYLPRAFTFENYKALFDLLDVGKYVLHTGIIAVFVIGFTITVCLTAAYAFARIKSAVLKLLLGFIFVSYLLPVTSTIIPLFQYFRRMHLNDTFPGLILLYTSAFAPFTVFSFITYYKQIPMTLEEAASIDGAGILRVIFQIIFPIMKPGIVTFSIINFILTLN